ncbi:hypothetical protein FEE95_06780 [Maribacter algarum]|uniref:Uncharacterized protein n=1 Tax=Maribacter algarum (ex Zhang et al. 2020) TaxID=2578118 RepID=A0A5S3PVU3_9FLAO|nr:DUF6730 family protein [Maribacter algarum]TMM59131.1 hypothetical protein FEE95_06780 [Maribacter algarum]
MKKMEEMMELFTDEIEGFSKSINKLESLSKNFVDLKIKTDTSSIEYLLKDFLKEQRKVITIYKEKTTEIKQGLRLARITPNWMATLFCITVTIQVLSLSYFAYHFIHSENRNKAAYIEGQKESNESARRYFEDHPIIYEDYKKWTRKKEGIQNQK